jgi:hypothetical protein
MSLNALLAETRGARRLLKAAEQMQGPQWKSLWEMIREWGPALLISAGLLTSLVMCVIGFMHGADVILRAPFGEVLSAILAMIVWIVGGIAFLFVLIAPLATILDEEGAPVNLTSFEALRAPSRRGLLLARWLSWLPLLRDLGVIHVGVAWALKGAFSLPKVGFSVLLWGGAVNVVDLVCLTPGLLLLPAVTAAAVALAKLLLLQPRWRLLPLWLLPLAALFLLYWLGPWFRAAMALPPLLWSALALIAAPALFVAQVLAVAQIEPWAQIRPGAGLAVPFRQVRAVRAASGLAGGAAPLRPLPWVRGRTGLLWAAISRDLSMSSWTARTLLFHLVDSAVLLLAMFVPWADRATPEFFGASAVLTIWACATISPLLRVNGPVARLREKGPQRLFLLGIDYRTQMLFNAATWWLSPAVLVALVAAFATGADPYRLSLVAAAGSCLLLRTGWADEPVPLYAAARDRLKSLYRPLRLRFYGLPTPARRVIVLGIGLPLVLLAFWAMSIFGAGTIGLAWSREGLGSLSGPAMNFIENFRTYLWWIAGAMAGLGAAGMTYRLCVYDEAMLRERLHA